MAHFPAHFNRLYLITLTILSKYTNFEVPHCEAVFYLNNLTPKYSPLDFVLKCT